MPDDDPGLDYGYSRRPDRRGLDDLGGDDNRVSEPARKQPRRSTRQMKQGALEEVRDHQEPPVTRVRYGKLGDGVQDYGLEVRDASGNLVLSATGLGVDVVDTDQLVDGAVTTPKVTDGAVVASKLTESSQAFGADLSFSATDSDTVAWTSGSIELADGTTHAINAGDTGAMSALTYIYFDPDVSTSALQTTTSISTATGEDKILLAVAEPTADAAQEAFFVPAVGVLGLNEGQISPDAISTDKVQANAITATEIDVAQLDAISADVGTLTAGLIQAESGTRFIDLDASGNEPFIEHPALTLQADGDATFSGSLSAASGSFSGSLDAASGTFEGSLNAVDGSFSGSLTAALQQAQSLEIVADVEGDVGDNVEVQLGADTLSFIDVDTGNIDLRIWPDSGAVAGANSISFRDDLVFSPFTASSRLRYETPINGLAPVPGVHVSTNSAPASLTHGSLWIQI